MVSKCGWVLKYDCVLLGYLSYPREDCMGRIVMTIEFESNICARFSHLQSVLINILYLILKSLFEGKCHYCAILQINKLRLREIK